MQLDKMMLFYVDEPQKSAAFYARILEAQPIDNSPGFAMFKLNDGAMLGLWKRSEVKPESAVSGGGGELGLHVPGRDAVSGLHKKWKAEGTTILQEPVDLDFGFTFTAADPDGHRIRVFASPM